MPTGPTRAELLLCSEATREPRWNNEEGGVGLRTGQPPKQSQKADSYGVRTEVERRLVLRVFLMRQEENYSSTGLPKLLVGTNPYLTFM